MTEKKRGSERGDHNAGRRRRIETDGSAVDFDHALLPFSPAEQFEFAPGQEPQIGHPRTGAAITVDGTNSKTAVATGTGKRGARLPRPMTALLPATTSGEKIGQEKAGIFWLIFGHKHDNRLMKLDQALPR